MLLRTLKDSGVTAAATWKPRALDDAVLTWGGAAASRPDPRPGLPLPFCITAAAARLNNKTHPSIQATETPRVPVMVS